MFQFQSVPSTDRKWSSGDRKLFLGHASFPLLKSRVLVSDTCEVEIQAGVIWAMYLPRIGRVPFNSFTC